MSVELRRAVAQAVDLVNSHSGETSVQLRFAGDRSELDFVANSARLQGAIFEFQAGFETYGGSVEELSEIKTEVIGH
ncbi:MAG: hypothetical protein ACE5I3_10660 [Phycisphaerae bacterium]